MSRNFGQHAAITAGLEHARGEWIVVMDCDLQDPPEQIHTLFGRALEGFDVVLHAGSGAATRSPGPRLGGVLPVLNALLGTSFDAGFGNFSIISRKVRDGVPSRARQGPPLPHDPALAGVSNDLDRPAARRPLCRGELLLVRDADAIRVGRAVLPDDVAAPMDRLRRLCDFRAGDGPGRLLRRQLLRRRSVPGVDEPRRPAPAGGRLHHRQHRV